jgi:hypothetical protein
MMFDLLLLSGLLVAIAVGLVVVLWQESRLKQAESKGMSLLLVNLSAQQREQYEAFGYFEVIGSDTHRRYRIFKGRFANVRELSGDDRPDTGRCFFPKGGLVAGDCMLAQKMVLENCESVALRVALPFSCRSNSRVP